MDPSPEAPAAVVAEHVRASLDDDEAIARFCEGLSVATCEIEHVPDAALDGVERRVALRPRAEAIRVGRDRLVEKEFVRGCGISTAPFARIDGPSDVEGAVEMLGLPILIKTRTNGYDGYGQTLAKSAEEAVAAVSAAQEKPLIAEGIVPFERELSIAAVRSISGELAVYPLMQNHHAGGILRWTLAPAPDVSAALAERATDIAQRLLTKLEYVGVLVIELFQVGEDLVVNEFAPRVHNSGHWTIEGAESSQFGNHVRAILGLPLGSTEANDGWVMFNLLGEIPEVEKVLAMSNAHLHLYDKQPRPGRKLGHVSCRVTDPGAERERLQALLGLS